MPEVTMIPTKTQSYAVSKHSVDYVLYFGHTWVDGAADNSSEWIPSSYARKQCQGCAVRAMRRSKEPAKPATYAVLSNQFQNS